jgi:Mg2+-importing ATPase
VTQTLIVFAIRTRRVPFFRSRSSFALGATTLAVTIVGAGIPFSPLAAFFGFSPLPFAYFGFLVPIAFAYIVLVEAAKVWFYRSVPPRSVSDRLSPQRSPDR